MISERGMRIGKKFFLCIAFLIGIVIVASSGLGYLFVSIFAQATENCNYIFFAIIAALIAVPSLAVIALIGVLSLWDKSSPKESIEEIRTLLLKCFNTKEKGGFSCRLGGEANEVAVPFEKTINGLHDSLKSVHVKVHAIDKKGRMLAKEINQVAADQANLFSLNAAIESVRSQRDGLSIVCGEILSLGELTGQMTNDIHHTATQLQAGVEEVIVELDHVLGWFDPKQEQGSALADAAQEEEIAIAPSGTNVFK